MIAGFSIAALLGLIGGLLITEAIAGLLAGLLGVGGGIVPVLVIVAELFNIPQEVAMLTVVATSLTTIIPTSISSAVAHKKRGAIDRDILRGWIPAIFVGALLGGSSALMGIGRGTLAVPVMTMMSVAVHRAIATASVFGLAIAVPAVCGFIWNGLGVEGRPPASLGFVNLPATVILFSVSFVTTPMGAKLAHGLSARPLKLAFAAFLAISGARMLWKFFS